MKCNSKILSLDGSHFLTPFICRVKRKIFNILDFFFVEIMCWIAFLTMKDYINSLNTNAYKYNT